MSYTENVRKILLWSDLKKRCCRLTELSVFTCLLCGKSGLGEVGEIDKDLVFEVRNEDVFSRIRFISMKLLGAGKPAKALINFSALDTPEAGGAISSGFRPYYFKELFTETGDLKLSQIHQDLINECCRAAALRVFFCVAGTISPPENPKCYIELYFAEEDQAQSCKNILESFSIRSGVSKRRNKYVCYIKNAEGVSDFLTVTGAPSESIKFQVAKTGREVNNNVNRVMNCDLANIEKIRRCAENETRAIEKLRSTGQYYSLPDDLREIAKLRLEYPDASHNELGALLNPQLGGSAVSKKMKQIVETAEAGR